MPGRSGLGIFYLLDYSPEGIGNGLIHASGGFQAMIDACGSTGGGLCAVPAGTYFMDATPTWRAWTNITLWVHSGAVFTGPGGLPANVGSNVVRPEPSSVVVGGAPVTQVFGDAPAAGGSGVAADSAHRHGMPGNGSITDALIAPTGLSNGSLNSTVQRANHSVNGLLNVWQRPVQAYTANNGPAGPDGLFITLVGTDTITCTQDSANADAANGAQFDLACAFVLGTGAGASGIQSMLGGYKLTTDNFRFWRGKQLTRSWRVRATVANAVRLAVTTDGTGGGTTFSAFHPGDGTWQTLSVTTPVIPADATFVQFKVVAAASTTFYVGAHSTTVGLVGSDPYASALSAADDLARCLRYYELLGDAGSAELILDGIATAAGQGVRVSVTYKAYKPLTPTVTKVGTWSVTNVGQPTVDSVGKWMVRLLGLSVAAGEFLTWNSAGNVLVEANP